MPEGFVLTAEVTKPNQPWKNGRPPINGKAMTQAERNRRYRAKKAAVAKRRPVLRTSVSQQWFSPPEIVAAARSAMGGIDLDPASCAEANQIVQATKYYTEDEDGLTQPWAGRVWLNPPYSYLVQLFVERFAKFYPGPITQACLLLGTHHETTRWFERHLGSLDIIICKPPYRLCFSGSKKQPAHGSMIVGVGVDPEAFELAFAPFGRSWIQRRR